MSRLIFERGEGESVVINGHILVQFVNFHPTKKTIEVIIDAPRHIPVDRLEIHEKKACGSEPVKKEFRPPSRRSPRRRDGFLPPTAAVATTIANRKPAIQG